MQSGLLLLAGLAVAGWLWLPRPPILPDPGGCLRLAIYQPAQSPGPPWHDEYRLTEIKLYGPHLNFPGLYEWLDAETLDYEHYGLYAWEAQPYDSVVIRVYERDLGSGREHDDLLVEVVEQTATEGRAVALRSSRLDIVVGTRDLPK
jgi:hypothetical protein